MNWMRTIATAVLVMAIAATPALADSIWTGAVDGDWTNSGNWDAGGVPGDADTGFDNEDQASFFASGNTAVDLGGARNVKKILLSDPNGTSLADDFTISNGTLYMTDGGRIFVGSHTGATLTIEADVVVDGEIALDAHHNGPTNKTVINGNLTGSSGAGTPVDKVYCPTGKNDSVVINGTISDGGSGSVFKVDKNTNTSTWTIGGSNNTYSGGTYLGNGGLVATADGALGTGEVYIKRGTLTLESSNVIDDAALLKLQGETSGGGSETVKLNFTGTEIVGSLSLDDGATFEAAGSIWGAVGSGAANESAHFEGDGFLQVVPEPMTMSILGLGAIGLVLRRRRK